MALKSVRCCGGGCKTGGVFGLSCASAGPAIRTNAAPTSISRFISFLRITDDLFSEDKVEELPTACAPEATHAAACEFAQNRPTTYRGCSPRRVRGPIWAKNPLQRTLVQLENRRFGWKGRRALPNADSSVPDRARLCAAPRYCLPS